MINCKTLCKVAVLLSLSLAPLGAQYLRGVNIAGAEFGDDKIPGVVNRDYTYNSEATIRYFAVRNLGLIRFPILWERMQPALRGPLDPDNLAALKRAAGWAARGGARLIIDIHNYGRYRAKVVDNADDLADLWVRLSAEFNTDPAVYAYSIMNEPHDMKGADWKAISQAVLTAIRGNGDTKLVFIPGDSWSSANRWPSVHGPAGWIVDPADNFAYEAHLYFDRDESGTYGKSYDEEMKADPELATVGSRRLAHFVDWCRANRVRGFLGEFGVPNTDPRWLVVLDNFLAALDQAGFDGTYWAAGEWWGSYALSVQPQTSYTVDRPQTATLLGHLPPGSFTSVSAASGAGYTFAPDSLVTGYGVNFPRDSTVELTDSAGAARRAPVLSASGVQVTFLLPSDTASGRVSVRLTAAGKPAAAGVIFVDTVAPTLFPVAQIVRVRPDGSRSSEAVRPLDPIEFGEDRLYLTLYGTGFGHASQVSLGIGSATPAVTYFGAQGEFFGVDQINAELPRALAGAGRVTLSFRADGKVANPVTLLFR